MLFSLSFELATASFGPYTWGIRQEISTLCVLVVIDYITPGERKILVYTEGDGGYGEVWKQTDEW